MFNLKERFCLILLGPRFGLTSVVRPQKHFDATDSFETESDLIFTSVCRGPGCPCVLPGEQPWCPPALCRVPSPARGKPALGEVSALLKWDAGDSCRHFSVIVHAAEEQAVLFLSLNIRFLKLTVSSKEPELKPAGSQELVRGQPQSRGCQRPR